MTFFAVSVSCAQEKIFSITEVVDETIQKKSPNDFISPNSVFFEDDNYIVSKTCSGEWGGTIKFKNKKTGNEYACGATCPVVVNKISGKYIVTNTLGHLSGFSEIIEIENPDLMDVFKLSKPLKKGNVIFRYVGDDEFKSIKGTHKLVDSIGIMILASFPYEGELFHVVTDFRKTFLTKIQNGKFVTIETISDKSIWTYNPEVIRTKDNQYIVFFENKETSGYIEILGKKVVLMRYK